MIKRLISSLLILVSANVLADSTSDVVNTTIAEFMQKNTVPGVAVLLYIDGKPSSYFYGYANREKKSPVTANTIFEIGSLTKIMTSLLLAQEIDNAKMDVDTSITDYLTTLPASYEDISVENLATHTAGFPASLPANIKTEAEFRQFLTTYEPEFKLDEQYKYSNVSIGLLGDVLEAKTHQSIDQLYRTQILSPLKMQPIGLNVPQKLKKYYATGYDEAGNVVEPIQMKLFASAAAAKASAADMQHFLRAAIGLPGTPDKILYPMHMTQATFVELPENGQGLAWQIHQLTPETVPQLLNAPEKMDTGPIPVTDFLERPNYNGNALIDKTGGTDGFRSYIAVIPNKKSGIVILANHMVSNAAIVDAGREILFQLANLMPDDPAKIVEKQ